MKKLALPIVAVSLLAGGTAIAQSGGTERAAPTRDQVVERTAERFARMDANGDGRLDQADRQARMAQRFAQMDTDNSGAITLEEMTAAHEQRREARADRRGGDGERMGRHRGKRGGGMKMLANIDTDNDGAITQAEFEAAALARFDRADANGDGTVSAEERRAAHQARRAARTGS